VVELVDTQVSEVEMADYQQFAHLISSALKCANEWDTLKPEILTFYRMGPIFAESVEEQV